MGSRKSDAILGEAQEKKVTNKDKVLELRLDNPSMRATMIAEELGITRERVRQILKKLHLETNIKDAPTKKMGRERRDKTKYRPRPTYIPEQKKVEEPEDLPSICPKCGGSHLTKENFVEGDWELKCFTCGMIVATGRIKKEDISLPPMKIPKHKPEHIPGRVRDKDKKKRKKYKLRIRARYERPASPIQIW